MIRKKYREETGEVAARPCYSCPKKAEKDQELKLEERKLKKEEHDLEAKRLQARID